MEDVHSHKSNKGLKPRNWQALVVVKISSRLRLETQPTRASKRQEMTPCWLQSFKFIVLSDLNHCDETTATSQDIPRHPKLSELTLSPVAATRRKRSCTWHLETIQGLSQYTSWPAPRNPELLSLTMRGNWRRLLFLCSLRLFQALRWRLQAGPARQFQYYSIVMSNSCRITAVYMWWVHVSNVLSHCTNGVWWQLLEMHKQAISIAMWGVLSNERLERGKICPRWRLVCCRHIMEACCALSWSGLLIRMDLSGFPQLMRISTTSLRHFAFFLKKKSKIQWHFLDFHWHSTDFITFFKQSCSS